MGLEVVVARAENVTLATLLERLHHEGLPAQVVMADGVLQMPSAAVAPTWREVRLKTPAGMVTLSRRTGGVAVVVFGNADAALESVQRTVAEALAAL